MIDKLLTIAGQFDLEGTIAEIKPLGEGFINDTYVVKTEGDARDDLSIQVHPDDTSWV